MRFRDSSFIIRSSYGPDDDRLHAFFVPALERSVQYDRVTGYFSSGALVSVARGLVGLLQAGGRVRLLAGAQLQLQDVRAMQRGKALDDILVDRLMVNVDEGIEIIQRRRLEVLTWLLREGTLEIKIAVRLDAQGLPILANDQVPYFHKKTAVFHDAYGDRIAIVGSNNESVLGLNDDGNAEEFHVFRSWRTEAWEDHGEPIVARFEQEWSNNLRSWRVLPAAEAIRERLVQRVNPPKRILFRSERDILTPTEPATASSLPLAVASREDVERLRRVLDAPLDGSGVGLVSAPVDGWPHQVHAAWRVVREFPRSFLLADEVGMGKTVEVGLVVRELVLSQRAQRILILAPASVLKQWQEELQEKAGLLIPRYDGEAVILRRDARDEVLQARSKRPLEDHPILLVSSHLARARRRWPEFLQAASWDAVVVDEAHHARRRGGKPDGPPNNLLELLQRLRVKLPDAAFLLLTATPMQMHPHEPHDLLALLNVTPAWSNDPLAFERYFEHLRVARAERDWVFLAGMLADHFAGAGNDPEPAAVDVVRGLIDSPLRARRIMEFHRNDNPAKLAKLLSDEEQRALLFWLRANTPLARRMFRATRATLHEYRKRGLLPSGTIIPERHVTDRFIRMNATEAALYRRIEDYIGRHYDRYRLHEGANRALGFIMTIYRRRLTSSFHAVKRSLQKRLEALQSDDNSVATLLDTDDFVTLENSNYEPDEMQLMRHRLHDERRELTDFITAIEALPSDEAKYQQLHQDLTSAFASGQRTAVVFTQYTDTLGYLVEKLRLSFGSAVASWSGDGGRWWDAGRGEWVGVSKSVLKEAFRLGDEVRILVGTDAMSEGLNLQTCGFLVNYDVPWNFMRVEQRIGRIDRIGGQPTVYILNYYFADTVEQRIFEGLKSDVQWFESIVGPTRPILGKVEAVLETAALRSAADRDPRPAVEEAIREIRRVITDTNEQPTIITDNPTPSTTPLTPTTTLGDLETELTTNPITKHQFTRVSDDTWLYQGKLITFRKSNSDSQAFLFTYGTEPLNKLTQSVHSITSTGDYTHAQPLDKRHIVAE